MQGQTIHAFYFIAATDSVTFENAARNIDLIRAKKAVGKVAKRLNYKLDARSEHIFKGKYCSKEGLNAAFSDFHCSDKDIVIFYYSGHGQSTGDTANQLPVLNLMYPGDSRDAVPLRVIAERLKTCGAHLVFMVTDCCNRSWSEYDTAWRIEEKGIGFDDPKGSDHCMVLALTACEQGAVTAYNGDLSSQKRDARFYRRLVLGEIEDYDDEKGNLPLGSWFTHILSDNVLDMLSQDSYDRKETRISWTKLIDILTSNLCDYVCGYNYIQKVREVSDVTQKYKPYYEIIFN